MHKEKILVLDFGSQYTQLIARRIRESKVYSEIFPYNVPLQKIIDFKPKGIILSGGPSSVYEPSAPIPDMKIFGLKLPILGVCYGMQLMAHMLGGKVAKAHKREYGRAELIIDKKLKIFRHIPKKTVVWMSHGDRIEKIPLILFRWRIRTIPRLPSWQIESGNFMPCNFIRKWHIHRSVRRLSGIFSSRYADAGRCGR